MFCNCFWRKYETGRMLVLLGNFLHNTEMLFYLPVSNFIEERSISFEKINKLFLFSDLLQKYITVNFLFIDIMRILMGLFCKISKRDAILHVDMIS